MTFGDRTTYLICSLTSPTLEAMRADLSAAVSRGATAVECRLDYLRDIPAADSIGRLLGNLPVPVIATFRPAREGGHYTGDEKRRLDVLRQAARLPRVMVDLEMDVPLECWPSPDKVILSHHNFQQRPADLDQILRRLAATPAAVHKIAFAAAGPEDALAALDLLRAASKPTLALAMGEAGILSRVLAKKFGAFGTFCAMSKGRETAPGQLTVNDMLHLYNWDSIDAHTAVYGVIGCPIAHSMSPAVHNAALAEAGLNAVYLPLRIEKGPEPFNRFMDELLRRPWLDVRGLSVTIPHKENALAYVQPPHCDDLARKIGAINTITLSREGTPMTLRGDNTDYAAAIDALCDGMQIRREDLAGRSAAVLGAGGVARAIVAGLTRYRAKVTVFNRTQARAESLAREFECEAAPLDEVAGVEDEIIINCTSLGMHPRQDDSPLLALSPATRVVFDTIYNPLETRLLRQARRAGCLTVSGLEMFVNQAAAQFELWTRQPAPRDVMRQTILQRLG